jgi:hypothetical protein
VGVALVLGATVGRVFGVAVAALFGAAFDVLGVCAYADSEKAKAKEMIKIDFITFAHISNGLHLANHACGRTWFQRL